MRDGEHSGAALLKRPVGVAMTAVIGLIVAAASVLVFVLDLFITPEFDALIVSFVVCGIGLTTGLTMLRRLLPQREPISLFAGPDGEPLQPTAQAETRAPAGQLSRSSAEAEIAMPQEKKADPIGSSKRQQSISRYKARESSGALGLITAIGVSLVLGGRLVGGWEFLSLAMPAGCVVALVLYFLGRGRQASNNSGDKIPVAGGIIGAAALTGVGLVMVRFPFLRDFLGLAILAGGAIAVGLNWSRRRRESSSSSFV
jgi:disulfide bond formation protein DsbB